VRIRAGNSQRRDWTWEDLVRYGIEYYRCKT
jgi:hypothetical protein